jgi:hypothetical protein
VVYHKNIKDEYHHQIGKMLIGLAKENDKKYNSVRN